MIPRAVLVTAATIASLGLAEAAMRALDPAFDIFPATHKASAAAEDALIKTNKAPFPELKGRSRNERPFSWDQRRFPPRKGLPAGARRVSACGKGLQLSWTLSSV